MNAFEKAIARIESEARRHGGQYPDQIDLTLYTTSESFAQVHPHEDYASHKIQRAQFVLWCRKNGIQVVNRRVRKNSGDTPAEVAKDATGRRKPYRLGLEIGQNAVAHFMVSLEQRHDPLDPTRPRGGED